MLDKLLYLYILMFFLNINDIAVTSLGLTTIESFVHQLKQFIVVIGISRICCTSYRTCYKRIAVLQLDILTQDPKIRVHIQVKSLLIGIFQISQIDDDEFISAKPSDKAKVFEITDHII